jgi:hypothetical protein
MDEFVDDVSSDLLLQDHIVLVAELGNKVISTDCVVVVSPQYMVQEELYPLGGVHFI